jgi:hypothetical protein
MTQLAVPILLALIWTTAASAARVNYQMNCDLGKGATQTQTVEQSMVIITPSDRMCRVTVLDPDKKSIFEYEGRGVQVFVGSITLDGHKSAVIQADAHPYQLFIVSLGAHARLLRTIENQYGFWLQTDCGGRPRIWTSDGAFQDDSDLDGVYHRDLFTPSVVLGLVDGELVDATPSCRIYFDQEIRTLRSQTAKEDVEKFRANQIADEFDRGRVKGNILKMFFNYLYTGREVEAREVLREMWPDDDRERLWRSVVSLRSQGVLSRINGVQ